MRSLALLCAWLTALTSCYSHPFELCNGIDDDDDPETVDGAEDDLVGGECDGDDADVCKEGSRVCVDGKITCNDATGDNVEICNEADDDCDGVIDEMFDVQSDVENCGECGATCVNDNGGISCVAGVCEPVCANGAVDCNMDPADGCEVYRDRNPTCMEIAGTDSMPGDSGSSTAMFTGTDEAIYQVTLQEVSTSGSAVRGTITLEVPPGLDYDLYVYCDACGGAIMDSSRNPAGMNEVVEFAAPDNSNVNDDHTLFIEVRFVSETACGDPWRLTISGNTGTTGSTCR